MRVRGQRGGDRTIGEIERDKPVQISSSGAMVYENVSKARRSDHR